MKYGYKNEVINAIISSSPLWRQFEIKKLTQNMRLQGLRDNPNNAEFIQQSGYATFLESISTNTESESCRILDVVDEDTYIIGVKNVDYYTDEDKEEAIEYLYPNKEYDSSVAISNVILASTNSAVDEWNSSIQSMNPNPSRVYTSRDNFCEVDDDKNILANMLNSDILNDYNATGVPTHTLELKVDDICLVVRKIEGLELATNTRIQILRMTNNCIIGKTLNENVERIIKIPKITFRFRLDFGESYQMTRIQFPLRLAYAMTFNKCQGQTLQKVLMDCRGEPFAHGHAYVAFSRVRYSNNIRLFVKKEQLHECDGGKGYMPIVTNIVYKNIIIL